MTTNLANIASTPRKIYSVIHKLGLATKGSDTGPVGFPSKNTVWMFWHEMKQECHNALKDPNLNADTQLSALITYYGPKIWGTEDRSFLVQARHYSEYPRDLFYPADHEMLVRIPKKKLMRETNTLHLALWSMLAKFLPSGLVYRLIRKEEIPIKMMSPI
jgi:hypothetical protein